MLRALVLPLCWTLVSGEGSAGADAIDGAPLTLQSDLLTVGRLEIQVRALHAGNAAPPPRSVVEEALSVFYGYKDVTILDGGTAWASHWSLSPGITQVFSIRFSATGIADGLRLGGLERALQTYLDAADAGILVEAASVNSLKWVEVGMTSIGDTDRTPSRHGWSAVHSLLSASVASSAGVALAFMAACFASVVCKSSAQQGDEETGDAPEIAATAAQPDRGEPFIIRKYIQDPNKSNRYKDRCISYASTAPTEGDELRTPMSKLNRASSSAGSISTGRSFDDTVWPPCDERDEEYEEESSQGSVENLESPPRQPQEQDGTGPAWRHIDPNDVEFSPHFLLAAENPL
mmetsp:Transcript_105901/g.299552  ORF Transcript_105901/g.299552 Transcript_105901/m.299552 type:complete len:347 (+) Transcript_105901:54-1094(+)|eukprot:CAMPEP_0179264982 /NCGR_PEP_ID=MMETSP0797-20121207/28669_1 /TAXON_ID=47934 /ORGANISM="Dinophysis acuminata, Strain DAEP01" /LENGTH=346 /DNA_ID=CAMNT_0020973177 /DNA_START=49 /DNA_END=1089 /DNA_ORIENTATION=-